MILNIRIDDKYQPKNGYDILFLSVYIICTFISIYSSISHEGSINNIRMLNITWINN